MQISEIELQISLNELEISKIELEISEIELEMSLIPLLFLIWRDNIPLSCPLLRFTAIIYRLYFSKMGGGGGGCESVSLRTNAVQSDIVYPNSLVSIKMCSDCKT